MEKKAVKKTRKPRTPKEVAVVPKNHDMIVNDNLPMIKTNVNPQTLISQAIDQKVPIEILERLLVMRDKLRAEEAEIAFREAMSKFQAECPIIPKRKQVNDKNGKPRYKYAPLEDIVVIVQPYIAKNDLSFDIQTETKKEPDSIIASVTVYHILGHSKTSTFMAPVDLNSYMTDPQKWASASTFAKRYAFCNAFGILTGDEDNDAIICDDTKHPEKDLNVNMLYDECKKKMSSAGTSLALVKIKQEYSGLNYTQEQKDDLTAIYEIRKKEMLEAEKEKLNANSK